MFASIRASNSLLSQPLRGGSMMARSAWLPLSSHFGSHTSAFAVVKCAFLKPLALAAFLASSMAWPTLSTPVRVWLRSAIKLPMVPMPQYRSKMLASGARSIMSLPHP